MQIFLKVSNGQKMTMDVEISETVENIKSRFSEQEGIPIQDLRLFFDGKQLRNNETLSEKNIMNESTLSLIIVLRGGMQIYVKTITGKSVPLGVELSDSIANIKAKVYEKEGVNPEIQNLIFSAKKLENDKTLADYEITGESTIYLVITIRGG